MDENLEEWSHQADDLLDQADIDGLDQISQKVVEYIKNTSLDVFNQSFGYYIAATASGNSNEIVWRKEKNASDLKAIEERLERIDLLFRKSINYFHEININDMSPLQNGLYCTAVTNYSNVLCDQGRFIESIRILQENQLIKHFPMAIGNLGLTLMETYAPLVNEKITSSILAKQGYDDVNSVVNSNIVKEHQAQKAFQTRIDATKKQHPDIEKPQNKKLLQNSKQEYTRFEKFVLNNGLYLNYLNDTFQDGIAKNDKIFIQRIVLSVQKPNTDYVDLLNQIKEDYCWARWLLYEGQNKVGIEKNSIFQNVDFGKSDFSALNSYQTATLKTSFRILYSIFDKIGFCLARFHSLGLKTRDISFTKIWDDVKSANLKKQIYDRRIQNFPIMGLMWIEKILKNDYKNKGAAELLINSSIRNLSNFRNAMEHRIFLIVSTESKASFSTIPYDESETVRTTLPEFTNSCFSLIRLIRESIIYLTLDIQAETDKQITVKNNL